jgi:endo-1,4-beta-xylanase
MYQYVVESYIQNVPAAQRYGITVWGVGDADSWIVTVLNKNDFPMFYNSSYFKKTAYYGYLAGLKKKQLRERGSVV